jgi:plastocyanin
MRRALLVLALATTALLAACGGDDEAESSEASGPPIEISETEFAIDPATVSVDETGTVTLQVVNDGEIDHALEIEGSGIEEETDTIEPGESAELTVTLSETGSYVLYCPIGNHREQGMEGVLTVGSAAAAPEDERDETGSSGSGGYG